MAPSRMPALRHSHYSYRVGFVVSHPFHKEREMDGARIFLTPSLKMLWKEERLGYASRLKSEFASARRGSSGIIIVTSRSPNILFPVHLGADSVYRI